MSNVINDTRDADVRRALNRLRVYVGDTEDYEELQNTLEQMWEYGYEFGYARGTVNADE